MTTVVTKLSDKLKTKLNTAEEIWVAVALLNSQGLSFLKDNLSKSCKQNFLIGLDLPSEPKALYQLYYDRLISDVKIKVYTDKEYYHPKLYLILEKNRYYAFVGSANCTIGGLDNNIELSIGIDDQKSCKVFLNWFSVLFAKSKILEKPFIDKYASDYAIRKNKNKEDQKLAREEKKTLIEGFEATFSKKTEFVKKLKEYRKQSEYKKIKKERKEIVEELRETIDYPNFNHIEVDRFFSLYELGHIVAIPKPTIKREIHKFKNLLKMVCKEDVDVAVRIDRALEGDLKIRGVGIGLLSKVLVIHRPDFYFVKNHKIETALKKYGMELPRGLSAGTKYKIINRFLSKICIETEIENFAILDHYLYIEGNKQ